MSFEASLKTHLTFAAITAIVQDRIYPVIRPQGTSGAALTYQLVTLDELSSLSGRASSLRHVRVQIDCWAIAHSTVLLLEAAVRSRMDTAASDFRAVLVDGAGLDDYESDAKLYRRMLEFSCWFNET